MPPLPGAVHAHNPRVPLPPLESAVKVIGPDLYVIFLLVLLKTISFIDCCAGFLLNCRVTFHLISASLLCDEIEFRGALKKFMNLMLLLLFYSFVD